MIRALALDLATRTGLAWHHAGFRATATWTLEAAARYGDLWHRLSASDAIYAEAIIVEAPNHLRGRATTALLLGLRGVAKAWAEHTGIPVFEASSSEVRKWAGVKLGSGEKERARVRALELAREAGDPEPEDGDQADAYLLLRWFEARAVEEA